VKIAEEVIMAGLKPWTCDAWWHHPNYSYRRFLC